MDGEVELKPAGKNADRSTRATAAQAGSRPSSYQYLLDLDIDLADELDVRMRLAARTALTASSTAGLSMAAAHAGALLRRASGAPGLRTPGS